jgi:CRISPR-associated endonuclease Cas1
MDGIADHRREARLPRVGHGLRRLVIIGADGVVTLAALQWLADQRASLVMLDRQGAVLVATGPVGPSDARLRRAQALAHHTGIATPIIRRLVDQKLARQERIARDRLQNPAVGDDIANARHALNSVETVSAARQVEARAALAYWSAWHTLTITFPRKDLSRVPEHWRTFGARRSPLSNSPRAAVNPPNAILNYLYALLESEARLAAAAMGLDPGIGLIHVETAARDSLACDLMEPVRPQVDSYLLEWLMREPLHREWFFEERTGKCRLMGPFAARLSETALAWRRAVAPVAEWLTRALWSTVRRAPREPLPPTVLTQRRRREARHTAPIPPINAPAPPRVCRRCGGPLHHADKAECATCGKARATDALIVAAERGREAARRPESRARLAATYQRHLAARRAWEASSQPRLSAQLYHERIRPALAQVKAAAIRKALGVCTAYAIRIRSGRLTPHPRHWVALARLVGTHSA